MPCDSGGPNDFNTADTEAAFRLGARVQFLMGTNVNTPFFQVPTPEFGHGARARVQGLDLVLGH